jgi:glycine dehydrogenase
MTGSSSTPSWIGAGAGQPRWSRTRWSAGSTCGTIDGDGSGIACDETTTDADVAAVAAAFGAEGGGRSTAAALIEATPAAAAALRGPRKFLTHPVFHRHQSEHEHAALPASASKTRTSRSTTSMIPLGSCTMKLNATAEMMPVSWPEFGEMHPFAPADQCAGYRMFDQLEAWLAEITGFAAVSLQPNAGSQGEYAGLLAIRALPPRARRGAPRCLPDPGARTAPTRPRR